MGLIENLKSAERKVARKAQFALRRGKEINLIGIGIQDIHISRADSFMDVAMKTILLLESNKRLASGNESLSFYNCQV